jgi:hypothetical protein
MQIALALIEPVSFFVLDSSFVGMTMWINKKDKGESRK